jgi:hypothetical protein
MYCSVLHTRENASQGKTGVVGVETRGCTVVLPHSYTSVPPTPDTPLLFKCALYLIPTKFQYLLVSHAKFLIPNLFHMQVSVNVTTPSVKGKFHITDMAILPATSIPT